MNRHIIWPQLFRASEAFHDEYTNTSESFGRSLPVQVPVRHA